MLVFGHAGLTLGAAVLLAGGARHRGEQTRPAPGALVSGRPPGLWRRLEQRTRAWLRDLESFADIRWLLLGALFPDVIDKPVGQVLWREEFSNGRIFSHTLVLALVLLGIGFLLYRRGGYTGVLALSFGSFFHLILDGMWRFPVTVFWPLLGSDFPRQDLTGWFLHNLRDLFTDPSVYIPEMLGLLVVVWFAWTLWQRRILVRFLTGERTPVPPHSGIARDEGR